MICGVYFLGEAGNVVEAVPFLPERHAAGLLQIPGKTGILDEKNMLIAYPPVFQTVLPEDIVDLTAQTLHGDHPIGRIQQQDRVLHDSRGLMDQGANAGVQRQGGHQRARHVGLRGPGQIEILDLT